MNSKPLPSLHNTDDEGINTQRDQNKIPRSRCNSSDGGLLIIKVYLDEYFSAFFISVAIGITSIAQRKLLTQ